MPWIISQALLRDFVNSHSSPEPEAASSAESSSVGARFARSNGSPTRQVYLSHVKTTEHFLRFQSGMTCKLLKDDVGEAVLTWFLAASHVRTSPQQGRVPVSPARAQDYGVRWRELSARWNRDSCLWKTPPSFLDEGWTSSLGTLPRWGSMRDGALWERVMLVRRTNETESGFLPTPVKYDSHGTWESNNYHGLGWSAKNQPERLDEKSRSARQWSTPVKHEDRAALYSLETSYRHFAEGSHQVHLAQQVRDPRLYPTPTVSSAAHRKPPEALKATASGRLESDTGTYRQLDLGQVAKAFHAGAPVRYPTPVSRDADPRQSKRPPERVRITRTGLPEADRPSGTGAQLSLAQAANLRPRMYPTPIKSDGTVSKNEVTLQKVENGEAFNQLARQVRREEMEAAGVWQSNPDAVRGEGEATVGRRAILPTPTHKNGLRNGNEPGTSGGEHYPNAWQSPGHPEYGELCAEWVEWIMGWPIGWTSLEPMDPRAFEQWLALIQGNAEAGGLPLWWIVDPSDVPESGIAKTIKPKDKKDDEVRIARIGCLGNGQVSAVIPAAAVIMSMTEEPPEN